MKTFLAQNFWYSCETAAVPIPVSPGVGSGSLPSGESDPSVTLDYPPGENLSLSNEGRPEEAPAGPETVTVAAGPAGATDHIHEIFFYARRLMKDDRGFVLDEARFLADIDETPLFVRDGDHLRRWTA